MAGGTLLVNRDIKMFPFYKMRLEALGFPDVHVTGKDKDGLNMLINELKPGYVLFDSNFYYCGTPYMIGRLLSVFPKLNIAVLTIGPFSDTVAAWFIFHGVKTYVKFSDGIDVFYRALQCFLNGKNYISPDVQEIIDNVEWPDVSLSETRRQKEILLMLCNGFSITNIEDNLQICKATVEFHIRGLMKIFNCEGREELIKTAHCLDIFSKQDLCFSPEKYNRVKLPDWAAAQIQMNKMRNEKLAISKEQ
jgi:DNA-binding NarL/FixJ family response regulator